MNEAQYGLFLSVGTWMCAVGAIFNLFKLKGRGNAALVLSAAFLVMGGLLWMIKTHASQGLIIFGGILLAGLLAADFVIRARQQVMPK